MQSMTKGIASEETVLVPFELIKNIGKTSKSSVPVLSAAKPWFSQGFSHIWPIALEFCSAHAGRCMAPAALHFASRTPNRVVFRVALGRQNTGALYVPGLVPIHTRGGGRIRTI